MKYSILPFVALSVAAAYGQYPTAINHPFNPNPSNPLDQTMGPASVLGIDFTGIILDQNNPNDTQTGFGSVDHSYRMGTYEISRGQIEAYNTWQTNSALDISLLNPTSPYTPDANDPATGVSWNEAARFVNYLNTSMGYAPAYKFADGGGANDPILMWTESSTSFRNPNAYFFLPSEAEWYKAAYYDPTKGGSGGYWDYAGQLDNPPNPPQTPLGGGTTGFVWNRANAAGPENVNQAGRSSYYGTMAQSGNVKEFVETAADRTNNIPSESRLLRGGAWNQGQDFLQANKTELINPSTSLNTTGFRVAAVPEPSGVIMTLVGMMGLVFRRRR